MSNGDAPEPSAKALADRAQEQLREFFVSWPLYRRLRLQLGEPLRTAMPLPDAISMPCSDAACKSEPTTTWRREDYASQRGTEPGELVTYGCVHCGRAKHWYWVTRSADSPSYKTLPPTLGSSGGAARGPLEGFLGFTFTKIGQLPGWSIEPAKEVKRGLGDEGENLTLYKNGLVCMSQSYGIGALGYFRRVVENAVIALLALVEEAARTDEDEKALAAVAAARASKVADEKLRLIADVIPASLRPGGVNPFKRLYDDYSRGIHALSDAECLEIASDMREALEYMFGNIRDRLDQAKAYRERITKRK